MQQLQDTKYLQQNLLMDYSIEEQIRRERLMNTIDQINHHYGRDTLQWAICGLKSKWPIHRRQPIHSATTQI